jgi:ceramide glucosyltransferase
VLFDPRRSFAWGGSCAVRTDRLSELHLEERWRGVLSDDLVLTQAVREAGLKIAYVPAALVPTYEGADRATCTEWCLRQMTMATLYLPVVRRYAIAAFSVFNGSVLFGLACLALAAVWGIGYLIPAALFFAPLPVSIAKASLRRRALFSGAPTVAAAWKVPAWRSAVAAMAVSWVMASGLLRTRKPTRLRWRGHTYDVSDPLRVRLIDAAGTPEATS